MFQMLLLFFLMGILVPETVTFIVGGCIGPKSVLERYLSDKQKTELRKMVHTKFDGKNSEQILEEVNRYVFGHVTEEQWHSIVPEIAEYQAKKHECSLYAQLLPKALYQQLLKSVLRASEMGASKYDVKRLVDDYVERLAKSGVLPDVMDKDPMMPRATLPDDRILSQGYRNTQPKWPKKMSKKIVHPTLIDNQPKNSRPMFPIARPTPFDLDPYDSVRMPNVPQGRGPTGQMRPNHRMQPQFRRYPEDHCDYYAGPCATSF